MTDSDDGVSTVADLLRDQRLGMLTTLDGDGILKSRPMALQEVEFDGDLWMFAEAGSSEIAHIQGDPRVNVAVASASTWISLTGRASVVRDDDRKKELWNAGVAAWLPQGPDDGSVVLIKVEADSAEYWDTPGGRVATVLSFAKAKLTGQRYDGGENDTVKM